ncbi:type I restriction enzyme HsdR N-terminal domain-containing protein [Adhaeribacter swui]|uniref:Type I restriction enzyme HsdR N-terminal domain-containing protein n=1 Tax=Adhaeribacter swui TaxID=2086471 RepID=A0A7G7GE58_9BACT|nr:type I restriction enzyme HsdR N-terminal domain-containing protein [Adhaeribacter swui]QNF35442.1 type I restriction enzyme HsdR N-terminal domain-containing protein [Adhaeribacter swui]
MEELNLPAYAVQVKQADDNFYIFDFIRRKYLVLTPEEWVRQHFIHYLVQHLQYPKGLISPERGLKYNTLNKRTDICVFDTAGQVSMLVECKATSIKITETTIRQATTYNQNIRAKYVVLTNGLEHYCWQVDFKNNTVFPLASIPVYQQV